MKVRRKPSLQNSSCQIETQQSDFSPQFQINHQNTEKAPVGVYAPHAKVLNDNVLALSSASSAKVRSPPTQST